MDKKSEVFKLIPEQGMLPLYFYKDTEVTINVLKTLYNAGIRAVEYTNRGEVALKNFQVMRKVCDTELPGMYLGIGTIKSGDMAQAFIDAGADFIVCPGLVESVAKVADKHNMLWAPGCMTPTEIIQAEALGAQIIKLFPGNILGPAFLEAIKALFPNLLFMPTGGVDLSKENIAGWFKAGVCAVGMGSKLIDKEILQNANFDLLTKRTTDVLEVIRSVRS